MKRNLILIFVFVMLVSITAVSFGQDLTLDRIYEANELRNIMAKYPSMAYESVFCDAEGTVLDEGYGAYLNQDGFILAETETRYASDSVIRSSSYIGPDHDGATYYDYNRFTEGEEEHTTSMIAVPAEYYNEFVAFSFAFAQVDYEEITGIETADGDLVVTVKQSYLPEEDASWTCVMTLDAETLLIKEALYDYGTEGSSVTKVQYGEAVAPEFAAFEAVANAPDVCSLQFVFEDGTDLQYTVVPGTSVSYASGYMTKLYSDPEMQDELFIIEVTEPETVIYVKTGVSLAV